MEFEKKLTGIEEKLFDMTTKVVEETGFILYEMDYISGSSTLRVFIMNKDTGSAVIEDCIKVDHGFTPYMEEADWVPDDIVLEVAGAIRYMSDHKANST